MSTQIDLGPVLSVPKGDWNADTTYERLNMVRHNFAAWICNVATSKGVEPTEDSADWYLQVKDISSVTSVNGMKGDVVVETAETPPTDDSSTRIATTEWVTGKLGDVDLSGIKEDTIEAAINASGVDNGTGELTVAEISAELARLSEQVGNKNVGDLWFGFDPKSKPANVQLFAGQLLSRASYTVHADLVLSGKRTVISESEWQAQVSANGFCPYYSSGDGSTTYRMPLIKGVHPQFVAALAEAGQYVAAGLPNITGVVTLFGVQALQNISGAFTDRGGANQSNAGHGSTTTTKNLGFDASRSNPIYGNSDTVQPPALTFLLGEYVVGSVAVVGEANAESLLAGQTLLDAKVSALEGGVGRAKAYITETWSSGREWYRKYSDGWVEQGGLSDSANHVTVTLPVSMANINYTIALGPFGRDGDAVSRAVVKLSTTTFSIKVGYDNSLARQSFWVVAGYYQ